MIDLHVHLDGSIRPETVFELGREQGILLHGDTQEELTEYLRITDDCGSLTEYLRRFEMPLKVLQIPSAIMRVTYELVEDLAKQGLEYAEIRFAPQLSTEQGLSQLQVTEAAVVGLNRALHDFNSIKGGLILCCMRGTGNETANSLTLEAAGCYLGKGVCAVDLAGAEAIFKTENYKHLFDKVREYKLPYTIHAGEADGPDSVEKALDFGTRRIGHGVRATESTALLDRIIRDRITLEVCPISNLHSKAVRDAASHPIRTLFDKGVHVTINTDNMTISNTNLQKEYAFLKEYHHFTDEEIEIMNQYAREAAFC